MHPKMFEGYDMKIVKKDELIRDIKEKANEIDSYKKVFEDLNIELDDKENKSIVLEEVNKAMLKNYDKLHEFVNEYIKEYAMIELFKNISDDLDLQSGNILRSKEVDIQEILNEYIKENI